MDFFTIGLKKSRENGNVMFPDFKVTCSKDLMTRGHAFYAIWDEEAGIWSTSEFRLCELIDNELRDKYEEINSEANQVNSVRYLSNYSSGSWKDYKNYVASLTDNYYDLDSKVIFADEQIKLEDYATFRRITIVSCRPCMSQKSDGNWNGQLVLYLQELPGIFRSL